MREHLAELRRLDPGFKVFGASKHQYRSAPASEAELARLEAALGTSLPAEYRDFLLSVGHGAGPYYGVWGPTESLTELQDLAQGYEAEEGRPIQPAACFPRQAVDLADIEAKLAAGDESPGAERDWPCDGGLPICHEGCAYWSVLVLAGEFAGRVWDVACLGGYFGEWLPARRPPGWWEFGMLHPRKLPRLTSPPTFVEWFAGWTERCLTDLSRDASP